MMIGRLPVTVIQRIGTFERLIRGLPMWASWEVGLLYF
jgi:hypothetical protein